MIHGFLRPRLQRLGIIRLGEKAISANSGREHPKDLPHFVVPEEVEAVTGPNPTSLKVMLPSSDWEVTCPTALEKWVEWGKERRCMCKGDGEAAMCRDDSMNWQEQPCSYKACAEYMAGNCTEVGRLNVILPDVNCWGFYTINTGSFYGINQVHDAFFSTVTVLQNMIGNPGLITRAECTLTREPTQLEYLDPKSGQRKQVTKCILKLTVPPITLPQLRSMQAAVNLPMIEAGELPSLPPAPAVGFATGPAVEPELDEPDEPECPRDLVANASPVGPDLVQKAAWAALLEQVVALGKDPDKFEVHVAGWVTEGQATRFDDLAGEGEAPQALEGGAQIIARWQEETQAAPEPEPAAEPPKPAAAAKRTATKAKPPAAGAGNLKF